MIGMNSFCIFYMMFFLLGSYPILAGIEVTGPHSFYSKEKNTELQKKLDKFLDTRNPVEHSMLTQFSSEELLRVWNEYKKEKPLKEKRKLWIIEEYFMREGNRIASSRLIYLFLAINLLLLLIWMSIWSIHQKQNAMARKLK